MLRFIVGTAGTGKTTQLLKEITSCVQNGNKAIFVVPEQFSFESEKHLFRTLGPKDSLQVEVLSITRLCNMIFREYGGLAGKQVTQVAKYLLMSVVVSELQDYLKAYKKSAQNIDFLSTLLTACGEFKTAGIPPKELEEFAGLYKNSKLGDKMSDLSAVYSAYQALLEKGYTDPDDDLMRACYLLENHNFFKDYHLFVDGYTTFMAGEFELLGHMIAGAKEITFAMTADSMVDKQKGVGVYSTVQKAITSLITLAENNGIPIAEPVLLENPVRYHALELAHLSKEFLQPNPKLYQEMPTTIAIHSSQDIYEEAERTAISIAKLVREENYRYKEIIVTARDHSSYLRALEMMLSRYEIPFFDDRKTDIESTPLLYGVISAVEAVRSNYHGESILFLAKSPIFGLLAEQVAMLENYCYVWSIRGALWENEFQNNPRGMVDAMSPTDEANLKILNDMRLQLMTPLIKLKKALSSGVGKSFAMGVYDFLQEIFATNHLVSYAEKMPHHEKDLFLEQGAQIWDNLIDVLDIFGEVLGNVKFGRNRLCELFRLAVSAIEIGSVPQTLDQVLVGSANRIRPWKAKAVFILGANEGIFPPPVRPHGAFSETERLQLIEAGMGLAPASFQQSILERFFAYFAVGLPSEHLIVSYSRADLQGKEQLKSMIVSQLQTIFPQLIIEKEMPEDSLLGDTSALAILAEKYHQDTPMIATLLAYFKETEQSLLEKMEISATKPAHQIANPAIARNLFGTSMRLSPSRVERYHRCPFSYFAQDGLGLRKRQKVEFSPLESGSMIHYVLQIMVQKYGGKGLAEKTAPQLQEEVRSIIMEYLSTRIEDMTTMPARFKYLFTRLCNTLAQLLLHIGQEFMQSLYQPCEFELSIDQKEGVEPLRLVTPNGIPITVEGIVDRVDIMEQKGKKYIRVVDYKSGTKKFELKDVLYGLNLQMLLYLFTIEEHGTEALRGAIPAGVLYMPVLEQYISAQRDTSEEVIRLEREKQWTMSGLLLDDEDSLKGMEADLGGIFIPVKQNKNGTLASASSIASLEELGLLKEKISKLITDMTDNLSVGVIPAFPINTPEYPTCSYCDYRSVCGYEEGDNIKEIAKMDRREVFNMLKEEDDV